VRFRRTTFGAPVITEGGVTRMMRKVAGADFALFLPRLVVSRTTLFAVWRARFGALVGSLRRPRRSASLPGRISCANELPASSLRQISMERSDMRSNSRRVQRRETCRVGRRVSRVAVPPASARLPNMPSAETATFLSRPERPRACRPGDRPRTGTAQWEGVLLAGLPTNRRHRQPIGRRRSDKCWAAGSSGAPAPRAAKADERPSLNLATRYGVQRVMAKHRRRHHWASRG
jgi:hypothetical protein